jgi:hypothetical protein
MTDSYETICERLDKKDAEIQKRILARPGSKASLKKLSKAGASEKKVLQLLCDAVSDRDFWRKGMRRKKRELESIANQLETVAKHAQRISLDPAAYISLWLAMLSEGTWEEVKPVSERSPSWIFDSMRSYAKNCRERAAAFGDLLRTHPPYQRRQIINCLIFEIWLTTGKFYDREVAFLLSDANEAVGRRSEFREEGIKRHRQRHVMPGIKANLSSQPSSS